MKKRSVDPLKAQQKRLKKEAKAAAKAAKKTKTTKQKIDNYEVEFKEVSEPEELTSVTETIDDLGTEAINDKASSKKAKKTDESKPKTAKEAQKELLKSEALKKKPKHEKGDAARAFKEFPVKMVKEISKIRWSGQKNLWTKFLQVVIFIFLFAALFYLVDLGFKELFTVMRVI